MNEKIELKINLKDPTLLDLAGFSKDMTELMVWATLIHNSQTNPNEFEHFGEKNITHKYNPFFISENKLKEYIDKNNEVFKIIRLEKKCIVIDILNSNVSQTFLFLFNHIFTCTDNIIEITSNIYNDIDINIDISLDLVAISKDRCQRICDKYNKSRD